MDEDRKKRLERIAKRKQMRQNGANSDDKTLMGKAIPPRKLTAKKDLKIEKTTPSSSSRITTRKRTETSGGSPFVKYVSIVVVVFVVALIVIFSFFSSTPEKPRDKEYEALVKGGKVLKLASGMDSSIKLENDGKSLVFPCKSADGKNLVVSADYWHSVAAWSDPQSGVINFVAKTKKHQYRIVYSISDDEWTLYKNGQTIDVYYSPGKKKIEKEEVKEEVVEPKPEKEIVKEVVEPKIEKEDTQKSKTTDKPVAVLSKDGKTILQLPEELQQYGCRILNVDHTSSVMIGNARITYRGPRPNSSILLIPCISTETNKEKILFVDSGEE